MSDQKVLETGEFTSTVEMLRPLLPDEELDRIQPASRTGDG